MKIVTHRMPEDVIKKADYVAKRLGMTRTAFINLCVSQTLATIEGLENATEAVQQAALGFVQDYEALPLNKPTEAIEAAQTKKTKKGVKTPSASKNG